MTKFTIAGGTEGSLLNRRKSFAMSRQHHKASLNGLLLSLSTIIIAVIIPTSALRTTDLIGSQHRLDPNSGISVRMTVTYEVPLRIDPEPTPINTFQTPDIAEHPYREVPSHVSHVRSTEHTGSPPRRDSVVNIQTSDPYGATYHGETNRRSISSTCNLPDQCMNMEDCVSGGIDTSCGAGKICCSPRRAVVSVPRSQNTGNRNPIPKGPVPTKTSVSRQSALQEAFDEGLPAAFHGYLLLSEHPRRPPSAPNLGRTAQTGVQGVSLAKSTGRTKPEQVRNPEYENGRYGGPPLRLGTAGTTSLSKLKQKETELLPDAETCGPIYVDSRITKGKDAQVGQFPWMVLLGFRTPPKTTVNFICAGSLINDRYVLTAAHCFTSQNVLAEVRLGEFDLSKDPDGTRENPAEPVKKEEAEEIVIHPSFSRSQLSHDIALVRLKNRVNQYTNTIKPVCLPLDVTFRGMNYTVSGWGKTDYSHSNGSNIIQTTNVLLLNHTDCLKRAAPYNLPLTTDQICAGGNQGHDVCSGDSGGPLTKVDVGNSRNAQSVNYVAGIISFGADMPCGTAGLPSVYTKVTSYLSWILENMRP